MGPIGNRAPGGERVTAGGRRGAERRILRPYDVRLRRELTHRRMLLLMTRRVVRVLSLHCLDAALIAAMVLLLSSLGGAFTASSSYVAVTVAIYLLSLNALNAYDHGDARRDFQRLFSGTVLATLILGSLTLLPPHLPFSGAYLLGLGSAAFLSIAGGRKLIDELVRQVYAHGLGLRRAILVGDLDEASRAIRLLRDDRIIDQYIVGHVTADSAGHPAALGTLGEIEGLLDSEDIQEVIIAASLDDQQLRKVAEACFERGTALFVLPAVSRTGEYPAEPFKVGGCPLLRLHPARFELPTLMMKRLFDMTAAALLLLAAAPVMLLIALAIKLESQGPVFFMTQRIGLGGRPFTMWKFRSMETGAEAKELELAHLNIYTNGTFKLRDDPRVTRVGRVLRRTSLDELPQLINVLFGDMSLVGPRPALIADLDRYEPHHYERLQVVPGITGPWQVGGRNLVTDFEQIVEMERRYIRSWSLLLDLKILVRTVGVVIRGDGAY
jgi:exopolysaccharide biosynthesis polyprenyl glycosylphosphotransferase